MSETKKRLYYTKELIQNGIILKNRIKDHMNEGNYVSAEYLLTQNTHNYDYDIEWCILESVIKRRNGDILGAKNTIQERYLQHEWNLEVNYNLGILCREVNDFEVAIKYFSRCLLSKDLTNKMEISIGDIIEDMCMKDAKVLEYFLYYSNHEEQLSRCLYCSFPDTFTVNDGKAERKSLIGGKIDINGREYYCGVCDKYFEEREGYPLYKKDQSWMLYKTEILPGKQFSAYQYSAAAKTVLAIMPQSEKQFITIKTNEVELELVNLLPNHFYYYTFESDSIINIKSSDSFVVSDPITLKCDDRKPKVILNLFVDGLAQKYIDEVGIEKLMPNTFSFFKRGTVCRSAYSNSEWTYPSLASSFTGRYTLGKKGHRIFQTNYCSSNLHEMELFPEILEKEGFFCAKIDGEWRATPPSGYAKGMGRMLFQPSIMQMFGDDAIIEMIEHLETFSECNNYVWAALPDLHDISDEFESTISTQKNTELKYRKIEQSHGTSVRRNYNEAKIKRYEAQLKRIDILLGIVYSYVEKKYNEDEYIVCLMSDHGQGYLIPENGMFLDENRNKIVMMLRGHNVPKGYCDEMIESVDLFPIILKCAEVNEFNYKDGNIPKWFGGDMEKEYTITESVFPGTQYYAAINTSKYSFFFTTEKPCSYDGYLDPTKYVVKLVEKLTGNDVTEQHIYLINYFTDIIFNHIKEYIKV